MGKVRGELEDLAFRYVDAVSFEKVQTAIDERRKEGEDFLEEVERTLQEKLKEHNIEARVEWRIKRLYSIYQKLQKQRSSVDQVYDLLAVRVITKSVQDCYAVFGLIHSIWRPVPGRIKDFIAMPRPNLYQSLHTTVMGGGGHQFEVQIRTEEMHRLAEEGIAAHWKYKANGSPISSKDEQRLAWVRSLVEWQREMSDPNEFLSTLKIDLYPEEVYTFTPKGKVVVLPKDASPVDFAYSVHTEVGQTCTGATRQWPYGAAAYTAAQRRHRRDRHPERPHAQPRLAHLRQELARPQQDQALAERAPARARRSTSAANFWIARRASTKSRSQLHRIRLHTRCQRVRCRRREGPARGHRLRQVLIAPGAQQAGTRR